MPVGDRDITLFAGGSGGFGDALNVGRDSYHSTVNWDCRALGRAVPAVAPMKLLPVNGLFFDEVTAAFEWEDSSGVPFLLMATGDGAARAIISKVLNGAITNEDTQTVDPYTDGVLYRFDQDSTEDPDEEMAWFCNGADNDILVRRKKDATVDTGATTTHTAKADHLGVVGGDLWRSKGYKMSLLILNKDPGIETNWGPTEIPVGSPTWPVNKIVELGGSPFALAGDGVFRYNAAPSKPRFDNLTPFVSPHADNGKAGFTDGRGRIYYDTVDGYILVLTFGSQNLQRPTRFNWIDRDTPFGRITAMTADIEHVYAAIEPGSVRSHKVPGLVVKKDDGGVFTTHTGDVTDQDFSTEMDVSLLTLNDFIDIGADEPFWGIHIELSSVRTAAGGAFSADYGKSGGTQAFTFRHDGTNNLGRDGTIVLSVSGFTDIFDSAATTPWIKSTIDSVEKYWIRLAPITVLTGAKIREIRLIPYRPPIDVDLWPITGYTQAGAFPKILVGTWQGDNILWHDVWTLPSARIDQLVVSRTAAPDVTGQRTLFAIASDAVHYMPVGPDADPVRSAWPKLADYGDSTTAMDEHSLPFSGHDFGLPVNIKSVKTLVIHGEFLQTDDEFWVYHRWDNGDRWYKNGPAPPAFPVVVNNLEGRGRVLHAAVQFKDGSRDAVAPYITHAIIPKGEWMDEGPLHEALGADIESPQIT